MSILAGFDAVIELGVDIIADKLRNVSIGGILLDPPTEIQLGDTTNGADILILDPIAIALTVGTDGITATVPFQDSTIYYNGQTVRPLKGAFTITGIIGPEGVASSDPTSTLNDLFLHVPPPVSGGVDLKWDSGAQTQSALGGLNPTDRANLESSVKEAVWLAIDENSPRAQLNFNLDDTRDGLLGKFGLRFRSVTVQNIDANTIGVFCMLLLSSTQPAAVVRHEPGLAGIGAAMSLSEAAFCKLVFSPSIAETDIAPWDKKQPPDDFLAGVAAGVPSPCDNGDFITLTSIPPVPVLGPVSLKQIAATFQDGSLLISGELVAGVASNDYCWRVAIDFWTNADLSVHNGAVQTKLDPDPPNTSSHIDINWYCVPLWLPVFAVVEATTFVIVPGAGYALANDITSMLVAKFANKPLNMNQTEQVGIDGLELLNVVVKPDRLTLLGIVSTPPPSEPQVRGVTLQVTNEQPQNMTEVGSGTYHYPGSMVCKAQDYPYTEYSQEDVLTLSATATLMGSDPSFTWSVAGNLLTGSSGTLTVTVPATIPQPGDLPGKDTVGLGMQTTTVDYQVKSPTELVLVGHGGFDYSVDVAVQCTSLGGFVSSDNLFASFTNRVMDMGGNYDQAMAACALASRLLVNKLRTRPHVGPVGGDPPNYGDTVQILGEAIRQNKPGATEMLIALNKVFGNQLIGDVLRSSGEQA